MNYRILPTDEFDKIEAFCKRNGLPMPNPATSYVSVAEKEGEIVQCHMAHLQLHLDNLCRDVEFHGWCDFRKVYREIEKVIPRPAVVYTYPSFENGIRGAEILGFHQARFPLMIKELKKCQ